MKKLFYNTVILVLLISPNLFAQGASGNQPLSTEVLKVYFFLLVFATIVNRIVEFVKLLAQWISTKWAVFSKIGDAVWAVVKDKLDALKIKYKPEKIRKTVDDTLITVALHTLGFVLGIVLCLSFHIGVINLLGVTSISPTLNYILSGILVGAGIEPVHSVLRLAGEKKKIKKFMAKIGI